jgi:hypothetical protein
MLQSALIRALFTIKKETGEMNNKIHNVGINLTLIQNAVKIPKISKIFNYRKEILLL